jgi:hypothetical protein
MGAVSTICMWASLRLETINIGKRRHQWNFGVPFFTKHIDINVWNEAEKMGFRSCIPSQKRCSFRAA